jgi:pullulanase/glycogen debranching enzyme
LKTSFYKLAKSKNSIAQIKIDHKKQEDTDQLQQNSYPLFLKLITKQPVFLLIITEQVILKIPRRNKNKQKQPISSSKEKSKKKKHKFNSQSISMLDISLQNFKGILVR